MAQVKLEDKLSKIDDLPSLSAIANNIILITQNPKTSALEVGRAISQDQALVSKILRVANSPFYGFPQTITTITHAIVILGFANIRNLVLMASIKDVLSSEDDTGHFDREEFWKHSLACGVTSKLLAKKLGIQNIDEAFIWGLLHDLGKLVLDAYFNEDFTRVVQLAKKEEMLISDAEQQVLGMDHAAVGGIVADKWNLHPALLKVIRFHHHPPRAKESMRLVSIVHLADVLCRAIDLGNGGDNKIPCVNEESWKLLDLNQQTIKNLFLEMEKEVEKSKSFLSFVN
jgi:putative nucleotidyltransferase with HDIG domain